MKRKSEWNTKKKKRRAKANHDKGIVDFVKILRHFFPELPVWINNMDDPRVQGYCIYTQADYIMMGILKNICGTKSMNNMDENFNEQSCIDNLRYLSEDSYLTEMPNKDSLTYYLKMLDPGQLAKVRKKMIQALIKRKNFDRARVSDSCWRIVLDGTGIHYYTEKPNENCLIERRKNPDGSETVRYFNKVLEAKLILGDKLVMSIDTEFVENESEDVPKQDCEINAARRLLDRIKEHYPRMPICVQGDALYAAESIMRQCRENGWHYIFTMKESRQHALGECYEYIKFEGADGWKDEICEENGIGIYCNNVDEVAGKTEKANIFEYEYTYTNKDEEDKKKHFCWLTDIPIHRHNLEEMIGFARGRWKIENEGFNNQKNGIYDIEHLNSRNYNAIKNHYLITQIADIIMQLYLAWSQVIKQTGQSIKNTSSRLLESFRRHTINCEDAIWIEKRTSVYLE